jgi:hypothetical protein
MGELNLDQIDRIIMQEYERRHDASCLEEAEKVIEDVQSKQEVVMSGQ